MATPPTSRQGPIRAALFLVGVGAVIWLGFKLIPPALVFTEKFVQIDFVRVFCLAGVAGIALALFYIRRQSLYYYGLVEIAFALVSAWNGLSDFRPGKNPDYLILLATAYLIVRGLVNFDEGRKLRKTTTTPFPSQDS